MRHYEHASTQRSVRSEGMEFRRLGSSGLKVSEISYGNWITHGSQVEEQQAIACVKQAIESGITTFDTADVYANTKAETVLGKALAGERRESLEIFTKVYAPTGPGGPNDSGLSRKHIMESCARLTDAAADRPHRSLPGAPLRLRDAARGDDDGVRRPGAQRQGPLHRRLRVDRRTDTCGARPRDRAEDSVLLEPAAVLDAVAGHRAEGRADLRRARDRPDRLVTNRSGRAHREVQAGSAGAGGVAGNRRVGWREQRPALAAATQSSTAVQRLVPIAADAGLSMAQLAIAWVLQNPNVSSAIIGASRPEQVVDNVAASGVRLEAERAEGDRRSTRRRHHQRPLAH